MAERYRTYITETAEADMYAAYEWIEAVSPQSASDWLAGLLDSIASLETFPERCALATEKNSFEEEIRVHLYRRSSVYRILFTIKVDRVVVLYIRHASRHPVTPE